MIERAVEEVIHARVALMRREVEAHRASITDAVRTWDATRAPVRLAWER